MGKKISPRQTLQRADEANCPEDTWQLGHTETHFVHEDNYDLAADYDSINAQEPVVAEHIFEYVE